MTREEKAAKISRLCDQHGCSDKIRSLHFKQFLGETSGGSWHAHPPQRFLKWFSRHPIKIDYPEANPTVYFNAESFYNEYCDAKTAGLA